MSYGMPKSYDSWRTQGPPDESHHWNCPCHEDAELHCSECDCPEGEGTCWLYEIFPYGRIPNALWDLYRKWVAKPLSKMQWTWGLFPSYCVINDDPDCRCSDFDDDKEYNEDQYDR